MSETMITKAFVYAVYPQIRGTMDSSLRAEATRRARRAIAALAEAGYEIVPRGSTPKKEGEDGRE